MQIKTKVVYIMLLKDVRHILDLRLNFISGTTFDKQGNDLLFGSGTWKLIKGDMVANKGHVCRTSYKTHVKICSDSLNAVEDGASPNF